MRSPVSGLLLIVAAALVGYALVSIVPQVITQYHTLSEASPTLGTAYLVSVSAGALLLLAATVVVGRKLWINSRDKRRRHELENTPAAKLSNREKEQAIQAKLAETARFVEKAELPPEARAQLDGNVKALHDKLQTETLEIVAFGTISSGKSALLNTLAGEDVFATEVVGGTTVRRQEVAWPNDNKVVLVDTPGLGEVQGLERERLAREQARNADLVLLVVDNCLRDFEERVLAQLAAVEKPILVCLNKGDWFADRDRELLLAQIREQVSEYVSPANVVPVRTKAASRTRIRVLPDGSEREETVELEADITPLVRRMQAVLSDDRKGLLLTNVLLRARGVFAEAREQLQARLDAKAWTIVERHMWQSGAATALIPVPVLDVLVGLGFTTKMVVELAGVYQQKMDLATAQRLLGELGKNLVGIVGINVLSVPAGAFVASMLKTLPGIGTLAGATLQGVVQALLARWIGGVFIEYFRAEMREPPGGLAELARQKWREVTQAAELAKLVQQAREHLRTEKTESA